MKVLDKYIIKSFLGPFFATFFVVLFIFVMQLLWMAFDDIAGKGIDILFILKFLFYSTLALTPTALPVGVLLSSIMAMGNFSENYEFAAAKSAGISLPRLLRPLIILVVFLSGVNFIFLNNVFPYASLKQKNLLLNIKKKKPSLALIEGVFNTEIPGYMIKFERKYGEEENLLDQVIIYTLEGGKGVVSTITADKGEILSEEGSKYMTLLLKDGHYFEDHYKEEKVYLKKKNMNASYAKFEELQVNIDLSSLNNDDLDKEGWNTSHTMYSIKQLNQERDTLKINYDQYLKARALDYASQSQGGQLKPPSDTLNYELAPNVLDNFDNGNRFQILQNTLNGVKNGLNQMENFEKSYKAKRKRLNVFDYEYFHRVAFSFSCLILFFIGAPLGSLIRKGGFGLPMILAIIIFVIYYLINTFGKNLVEESSLPASLGAWTATIILLPAGLLLTRRAAKDKGGINLDPIITPVTKAFQFIGSIFNRGNGKIQTK